MRALLLFSILNVNLFSLGQAIIKFDTTEYNYPDLIEGTPLRKEISFTNTGNEPLIIQRVSTGDGGSYAEYSREPIPPGKRGVIKFIYDTKRLGPFNRSITVQSNAQNSYEIGLRVKGEVIRKRTSVEAVSKSVEIGALNYGEVDTVFIKFRNTGSANLYIRPLFNSYTYPEPDVFSCQLVDDLSMEPIYAYDKYYEPGQVACFKLVLRNVYGNTGHFSKEFYFGYNSKDTVSITVTGGYINGPSKDVVFEEHTALIYNKDQLVKKLVYSENGYIQTEYNFTGSYCSSSKHYNYGYSSGTTERYFKNGREIKLISTPLKKE